MTRLERLIREAREAAQFRGHNLTRFDRRTHGAYAECVNCQKWVAVETRPMPNSIDIGGPAVAVGCED